MDFKKLEEVPEGPLVAAIRKQISFSGPRDDLTVFGLGLARWFSPSSGGCRYWRWSLTDAGQLTVEKLTPGQFTDEVDTLRVRELTGLSTEGWNRLDPGRIRFMLGLYRLLYDNKGSSLLDLYSKLLKLADDYCGDDVE